MQLNFDRDDLRPLIETVIAETVARLRDDEAQLGDAFAFNELTAARMLGLNKHQLRDERLRGRIGASRIVGGQIRYTKQDLLSYLARKRTEAQT